MIDRLVPIDADIAFRAQQGNMDRAKAGRVSDGDYVRCKDGRLHRIADVRTHDADTGVLDYQPGYKGTLGGFYLWDDSMSFSGSLDNAETRTVRLSDETMSGNVWFFSERQSGAGRGVHCFVHVPVWVEV